MPRSMGRSSRPRAAESLEVRAGGCLVLPCDHNPSAGCVVAGPKARVGLSRVDATPRMVGVVFPPQSDNIAFGEFFQSKEVMV